MSGAVNFTPSAMVDGWRRAWRRAWPSHCLACGGRGTGGRDLCAACHAGLPWLRTACPRCALPLPTPESVCGECLRAAFDQGRPPLQAVHAAFVYARPLDRLLPRFKFHGDLAAGRLLAALMGETAPPFPRDAVIVPVPLHRQRLRMRGSDQALVLAKPLAVPCGGEGVAQRRHRASGGVGVRASAVSCLRLWVRGHLRLDASKHGRCCSPNKDRSCRHAAEEPRQMDIRRLTQPEIQAGAAEDQRPCAKASSCDRHELRNLFPRHGRRNISFPTRTPDRDHISNEPVP